MARNLITIGLVLRDNKCVSFHSMDKKLGDVSILLAKSIVIHKALRIVDDHNMDKIFTESDLQLKINSQEEEGRTLVNVLAGDF